MITIIACIKCIRSELLTVEQHLKGSYTINPYDLFMLKWLTVLKKEIVCRIIGVFMGPMGCLETIQKCTLLGLDEAFLISDPCLSGSDTYATSYILYKALQHIGAADIYAFGEKAVDGETGQIPVGVASRLNLPCFSGVEEVFIHEGKVIFKRQYDNNIEELNLGFPVAVSFRGFTTTTPKISLNQLKQARKYTPAILTAESLNLDEKYYGQNGSKTKVKHIENVINGRASKTLYGTVKEKAELFQKLIEGGSI